RPDVGIEWQTALAVGYGDASYGEGFGYHALEGLQVMMERRKGGETGVKAVHYLEGKAAWEAAKAGQWDRGLLDAALTKVPVRGKGQIEEDAREGIVYLIEYRDGLGAAFYLSPLTSKNMGSPARPRAR